MVNVIPLFNKGNHSQPNNYRPISLTSIVSKLFEHQSSSNIRRYLEANNILYNHQHGFRLVNHMLILLVQNLIATMKISRQISYQWTLSII